MSHNERPAIWRVGDDIEPVKSVLRLGGVVGIPTESSYGLAVDPRSETGVAAIYELKRREARKPLPLVVADEQQARDLGLDVAAPAFRFGVRHWPAPLTMLVPFANRSVLALGELDQVAVRIPEHEPLLELLIAVGHGLTSTSANLSGQPPLLDARSVQELLCETPNCIVVDSPVLTGGAPSTVVAWQDEAPRVLRQGRFDLS